jgi:hypothetical protein
MTKVSSMSWLGQYFRDENKEDALALLFLYLWV